MTLAQPDTHLDLAREILAPARSRETAPVRTIFTTEHPYDAGLAGLDGPEPAVGCDGGFSVVFDGRHSIPSVRLNGSDGQIEVCGYAAIRELASALREAERMAARMTA